VRALAVGSGFQTAADRHSREANGSRDCAPDDRLRDEAIHACASREKDCFAALAMTVSWHTSAFPRQHRARVLLQPSPSKQRGRRECRVLGTPAASRAKWKSTRVSHHRYAETIRHSLRDGLRLIRDLPGVPGFLATVACGLVTRKLDPSVGGTGPHAFAVRNVSRSSGASIASTASRAPRS
jgi:hypothetical protein